MRDPELLAIQSALIHHAADLACGRLLPAIDTEHWYATTPLAERRSIIKALEKAEDRHKDLAITVRKLADRIARASSGASEGRGK